MRTLLLIHRYLGFVGGALMLMWCVTGFVMMRVHYPELETARRLAALPPIAWPTDTNPKAHWEDEPTTDFRIEMLGDRAVLSRRTARGAELVELATGAALDPVSADRANDVAKAYEPRVTPRLLGLIDHDQWTVAGQFLPDRPLYHFGLNDAANTEVYVSRVTGQLVQATTRRERFWNWLGAIPHWLYFSELRRHPKQWQAVVMASSLVGCFLTLTGIWLSVQRWPWPKADRASRPRGIRRWHQVSGLIFGLFALTWVASGLLSVEPWRLLQSSSVNPARPLSAQQVRTAIHELSKALRSSSFVSVEYTPARHTHYFIASAADGSRRYFDASGLPTPLNALSAAQETEVNPNDTASRWIERVHRLDLLPGFRARPFGNLLVLLLLSGVSAVCFTGCCLTFRKRKTRAICKAAPDSDTRT